ncbi:MULTISPECIES: co-chaperone YbbN [Anaerolinea]|jgi:thioredoxin 1|uniref:thioredoxin family protein n=1 Tax=Anaerolinea TaxID=233189 RepID=UPI0026260E76|nr:thioredoxin family protein [Anaerolinea thermophila]
MEEIFTRLLIALFAGLSGWGVYVFLKSLSLKRAQRMAPPLSYPRGTPFILYFTTPDCAPCRTVQRPVLQSIKSALGDRFRIVEVNAYEQPELVQRYGILSIPTTFVFDSAGVPRFVNHGVARKELLLQQLQQVMDVEPSSPVSRTSHRVT